MDPAPAEGRPRRLRPSRCRARPAPRLRRGGRLSPARRGCGSGAGSNRSSGAASRSVASIARVGEAGVAVFRGEPGHHHGALGHLGDRLGPDVRGRDAGLALADQHPQPDLDAFGALGLFQRARRARRPTATAPSTAIASAVSAPALRAASSRASVRRERSVIRGAFRWDSCTEVVRRDRRSGAQALRAQRKGARGRPGRPVAVRSGERLLASAGRWRRSSRPS